MAGPGNELAAAGRGHLRAAHADRERVISILKAAFVQGMLAKDEFDLRVGQTFASRTYAELAAVIADIPAGLAAARGSSPSQAQGEQPVVRPGPLLGAATAAYAGVWAYVLSMSAQGDPSISPLMLASGLIFLGVMLICVAAMGTSRHETRSGGPPPPASTRRGR